MSSNMQLAELWNKAEDIAINIISSVMAAIIWHLWVKWSKHEH